MSRYHNKTNDDGDGIDCESLSFSSDLVRGVRGHLRVLGVLLDVQINQRDCS